MFQTDSADEYHLDKLGRICPVHQTGWVQEEWQDASSFDEAMESVGACVMTHVFPNNGRRLLPEELGDLQARRYLDIGEGFYLATAIDVRFGVWRFMWQDAVFFTIRPDFFLRSLISHLSEPPINALEKAVRDRLLDCYRELDALKYALAKGEIEATSVYPVEWWTQFWRVRRIFVPEVVCDPADATHRVDKTLQTTERNTLLTVIAALFKKLAIDLDEPGAVSKIVRLIENHGPPVSDDTVRRILAKIPEALESRGK